MANNNNSFSLGLDLGSLGGALFGGLTQINAGKRQERLMRKQADIQDWAAGRQLERDKELMDYQNQQQIDFWNMNNEYNSASAQRERLEDANLLGASLMGNGSMGTPATMPSASGATSSTPSMPFHSEISATPGLDKAMKAISLMQGIANVGLIRATAEEKSKSSLLKEAQTKQTLANTMLTNEKIKGLGIENNIKAIDLSIAEATKTDRIALQSLAVSTAVKNLELLDERILDARFRNNKLNHAEYADMMQGVALKVAEVARVKAATNLALQQIGESRSRVFLNMALREKARYDSQESAANTEVLRQTVEHISAMMELLGVEKSIKDELLEQERYNTKTYKVYRIGQIVNQYADAAEAIFTTVFDGVRTFRDNDKEKEARGMKKMAFNLALSALKK